MPRPKGLKVSGSRSAGGLNSKYNRQRRAAISAARRNIRGNVGTAVAKRTGGQRATGLAPVDGLAGWLNQNIFGVGRGKRPK